MGRVTWHVQVDDLVGGYIVADKDLPTSAHDYRADGDPDRRAYVIAECHNEDDAEVVAALLNASDYVPKLLQGKELP